VTQAPTVTSWWQETTLAGGVTTWIPITFTQTFASVPQQWASPGAGAITMGDGTKKSTVQTGDNESGADTLGAKSLAVGAIAAVVAAIGLMV